MLKHHECVWQLQCSTKSCQTEHDFIKRTCCVCCRRINCSRNSRSVVGQSWSHCCEICWCSYWCCCCCESLRLISGAILWRNTKNTTLNFFFQFNFFFDRMKVEKTKWTYRYCLSGIPVGDGDREMSKVNVFLNQQRSVVSFKYNLNTPPINLAVYIATRSLILTRNQATSKPI